MHKHEGIRIYNFIGQHNTTLQKSLNVPAQKKVDQSRRWLSKRKLISILVLALVSSACVYYYLQKQRSCNNQPMSFQGAASTEKHKHARQKTNQSKILKTDDKEQLCNRACFYDIVFKMPKILKKEL
jgi:hypothetical protein